MSNDLEKFKELINPCAMVSLENGKYGKRRVVLREAKEADSIVTVDGIPDDRLLLIPVI